MIGAIYTSVKQNEWHGLLPLLVALLVIFILDLLRCTGRLHFDGEPDRCGASAHTMSTTFSSFHLLKQGKSHERNNDTPFTQEVTV